MRNALRQLAQQHQSFAHRLVQTHPLRILVTSRVNRSLYWYCTCTDGMWKGRNRLGELFMELRDELIAARQRVQKSQDASQAARSVVRVERKQFQSSGPSPRAHAAVFRLRGYLCVHGGLGVVPISDLHHHQLASLTPNLREHAASLDLCGVHIVRDLLTESGSLMTWEALQAILRARKDRAINSYLKSLPVARRLAPPAANKLMPPEWYTLAATAISERERVLGDIHVYDPIRQVWHAKQAKGVSS